MSEEKKEVKPIHYFVGGYTEFDYFIRRWKFNPREWKNISRYEEAVGRIYYKGYVHYGDSFYALPEYYKIGDYIDVHTIEEETHDK